MKLNPLHVGFKEFTGPVTATDPGYDHDVWCVIHDINIKPGRYSLVVYYGKEYYEDEQNKRHYYSLPYICAMYHESLAMYGRYKWRPIGSIGVDAGLAGFFQNKPDYNDEEWEDFCRKMRGDYCITQEGFCTRSGIGDGVYDVYATYNDKNEIIGVEIRFCEVK